MLPRGDMLATNSPVRYGCFMAIGCGVVLAAIGLWMLVTTQGPTPLRVALVLAGVAGTVLAIFALFGSRIGWAFSTAFTGTLAVTFLFGAPKLRDSTGVGLLVAALPSILLAVTTILLSLRPADADQQSSDSASEQ